MESNFTPNKKVLEELQAKIDAAQPFNAAINKQCHIGPVPGTLYGLGVEASEPVPDDLRERLRRVDENLEAIRGYFHGYQITEYKKHKAIEEAKARRAELWESVWWFLTRLLFVAALIGFFALGTVIGAKEAHAQDTEECFGPWGSCPKHVPGFCFATLNQPVCLGNIDCGDGSEEDLVWRAYPLSIEALCRSVNYDFKYSEYWRCKFLHSRRKRLGKQSKDVWGVKCTDLLK